MGVYEGRGQLGKSMKELMNRWFETKGEWHDTVSEQFEKRYLQPLEKDMRSALAAMDHIAVVLSQARRDCQ